MPTHPIFFSLVEEEDNEVTTDGDTALDPLQQARKRRQRLAAISASTTRGGKRAKLTSEFDEFMVRTNKADLDVEDHLEWWIRHTSDYRILSKMAFNLFSCLAMSAECEPVFLTDEEGHHR